MTKIYEAYNSGILCIELLSSEETISQCYSRTFIDKSHTFKSCDLTCIKICLSFHVCRIRRDRHNNLVREHFVLLEIRLQLFQEESKYLFRTHNELLTSTGNFHTYFLVVYFLGFIRDKLFFLFILLRTFSI